MIRRMLSGESKEILIALAIVLALIGLLLLLVLPTARKTGDLTRTARTWLEMVANRRYDEAFEILSPAYRDAVSRERFRQAISENPYLLGFRSFRRTDSTLGKDRAEIGGELKTDAGQFETRVHFGRAIGAAEGAEAWYVTEILVNGAPILPRP